MPARTIALEREGVADGAPPQPQDLGDAGVISGRESKVKDRFVGLEMVHIAGPDNDRADLRS